MRRIAVVVLFLSFGLVQADEHISDIRIEIGSYTTYDRREHLSINAGPQSGLYTSGSEETTSDTDSGRGSFCLRYCAGETAGIGGTMWEVALASFAGTTTRSDIASTGEVTLQDDIIELQLGAGYALATGSWSHLELLGEVGVGYLKADQVETSQVDGSVRIRPGKGIEGSLGVELGWMASFEQRIVYGVAITAAWREAHLRGDFDTGTTYHGRLSEIMVSYLICIGIRF